MCRVSEKSSGIFCVLVCAAVLQAGGPKNSKLPVTNFPVELPSQPPGALTQPSPGSLYSPDSVLADVARDSRAHQVNDLITILVSDKASAVTSGVSQSQRKSSATASIDSVFGKLSAKSALANLASLSGNTQLQGSGTTSRNSTLSTTVSARVVAVLANGNLVVEGGKFVQVNSDSQRVLVRGVIRQIDISPLNQIPSDQIADLEVRINGKGLVSSAVRQPNLLYRLFLGLLPF